MYSATSTKQQEENVSRHCNKRSLEKLQETQHMVMYKKEQVSWDCREQPESSLRLCKWNCETMTFHKTPHKQNTYGTE